MKERECVCMRANNDVVTYVYTKVAFRMSTSDTCDCV